MKVSPPTGEVESSGVSDQPSPRGRIQAGKAHLNVFFSFFWMAGKLQDRLC